LIWQAFPFNTLATFVWLIAAVEQGHSIGFLKVKMEDKALADFFFFYYAPS
jgi:hypothetical protein